MRASFWALSGLVLVRMLRRGALETAVAVGLFYAIAAPVQQLLPDPLVPGGWASGQHWALAISQFACGAALALWFAWQGPRFMVSPVAGAGEPSQPLRPRRRHRKLRRWSVFGGIGF
jgi:hypothetical protein